MKAPKILIIEDERHIQKFLEFILVKQGCQTMSASDGRQARAALADFRPDGILLDLGLPDVDGIDLLTEIRAGGHFDKTKVIVLSATLYEDLGEKLDEAGADAQCSKPIAPSTLVKILQNLQLLPAAAI